MAVATSYLNYNPTTAEGYREYFMGIREGIQEVGWERIPIDGAFDETMSTVVAIPNQQSYVGWDLFRSPNWSENGPIYLALTYGRYYTPSLLVQLGTQVSEAGAFIGTTTASIYGSGGYDRLYTSASDSGLAANALVEHRFSGGTDRLMIWGAANHYDNSYAISIERARRTDGSPSQVILANMISSSGVKGHILGTDAARYITMPWPAMNPAIFGLSNASGSVCLSPPIIPYGEYLTGTNYLLANGADFPSAFGEFQLSPLGAPVNYITTGPRLYKGKFGWGQPSSDNPLSIILRYD